MVEPKNDTDEEEMALMGKKILYYNAFTEDLFYWDNDLQNKIEPKLKIHPNAFTNWIFEVQGQDRNVIKNFQHYTNEKLTPHFNAEYITKGSDEKDIKINASTEVTFSYERGNDESSYNIKISKGEESCFIWSVFYSLLDQVIGVLDKAEPTERETNQFDSLEYVFIDDPISSLDENHLIELAVNLAKLIRESKSELKFIITTHNPLFYNVLSNEFSIKYKESGYTPNKHSIKYCLTKTEALSYELESSNDSPFSYHLLLLNGIRMAAETGQIYKYHFNFLRNILEKTSTFLGYKNWFELLTSVEGDRDSYIKRIINLSSHSKHSGEEISKITENDKNVFKHLVKEIFKIYRFNNIENTNTKEEIK